VRASKSRRVTFFIFIHAPKSTSTY